MFHYGSVQEAKEDSDSFLTGLIDKELAQKSDKGGAQGQRACLEPEQKGVADVTKTMAPEAMEMCDAAGVSSSGQEGDALVRGLCLYPCISGLCHSNVRARHIEKRLGLKRVNSKLC